jgi:hypothetical protein
MSMPSVRMMWLLETDMGEQQKAPELCGSHGAFA